MDRNLNFTNLRDVLRNMTPTFKCPRCGNEYSISDAKVEKIIVSSKLDNIKIKGRRMVATYQNAYYNVRFCPKCYKNKIITKWVINILIFIIFTAICVSHYNPTPNISISDFIVYLFFRYFGMGILMLILNHILDKTLFDVDLKEAYNNNAIDDSIL